MKPEFDNDVVLLSLLNPGGSYLAHYRDKDGGTFSSNVVMWALVDWQVEGKVHRVISPCCLCDGNVEPCVSEDNYLGVTLAGHRWHQ